MTDSFFDNIPLTKYNNDVIRDITRKGVIRHSLFNNPYVFLPYTVIDDERPENVAYYYYGDPELVWLIYLANNIIDPFNQWPLTSDEWDQMMIKKYQTISQANDYAVLNWAQNQTITENIVYYQNINDKDIKITPFTYDNISVSQKAFYTPIRIYDWELTHNDDKRIIQLIDKRYAKQAVSELRRVMFNG